MMKRVPAESPTVEARGAGTVEHIEAVFVNYISLNHSNFRLST